MTVKLVYTSVGCNRVVQSLAWSCKGLVAYAAHNSIVICNSEVISSRMTLLNVNREPTQKQGAGNPRGDRVKAMLGTLLLVEHDMMTKFIGDPRHHL